MALAGDTLAIGARLTGDADTGAAYVFDVKTGDVRAAFTDGEPDADLGWAIVARPDEMIVGAAGEEGEVHVYRRHCARERWFARPWIRGL